MAWVIRFPIFSSSPFVFNKERLSPCSITSGINIPVIPRIRPTKRTMVLTTANVFGNLSFFLKNKIIGFAINAMMAAIII